MAPKFYRWTKARLLKLRRATLAAFLAFVPPLSTDAPLDFTVGRPDAPTASMTAQTASPAVVAVTPPSLSSLGYDITTEDARITCRNTRRGTTAEFLVKTASYGGLTGRRIVSVLEGDKWIGFGFADEFGIKVWGRMTGESKPYAKFARFLENLSDALTKGVTIEIERLD